MTTPRLYGRSAGHSNRAGRSGGGFLIIDPGIIERTGSLYVPRTLGAGTFRDMAKRTLEELDAVLQQAGLPSLADLRRKDFTEEQIQSRHDSAYS